MSEVLTYSEVYIRINYETAMVTFIKKDGTPRLMLCTRNMDTIRMWHGELGGVLAGFDKRNSIKNGNISVIDIAIGEGRSFNIDRVTDIKWFGTINDKDELERLYNSFEKLKKEYDYAIHGESMENMNIDKLGNGGYTC